jgi:predicted AAA+ superfamily ATPase
MNYVTYLKRAYLLAELHKYSAKSKIRIRDEKVYAIDVALMNNRLNAFAGQNLGWRLETAVYLELLRRYRPLQYDIYYYSTSYTESDFVVCQGNQAKMILQVSYDISNEKTRKRELMGLEAASRETRCETLLLITDHEREEVTFKEKKIRIVPAYEWLLEENEVRE